MLYNKDWEKPVKINPVNVGLSLAADYIEQHGWCQGEPINDKGQVCAIGAIRAAMAGKPEFLIAVDKFGSHLNLKHAWGAVAVAKWNNQPRRTKEQVIKALRAAAQE